MTHVVKNTILCIYHAPCNDGSASAAALRYRLLREATDGPELDIRFCPLAYNSEWDDPFPENVLTSVFRADYPVTGIYLVDISISATKYNQVVEYLRSIARLASAKPHTVCIDHHQTALEKTEELGRFCDELYIKIGPGLSGATLVWYYFNERFGESSEPPILLRYVADQDIWEWKLPSSHEVNAALNVLDGTVESMTAELDESLRAPDAWFARRRTDGEAITAMVQSQVARSARNVAEVRTPDGPLLVVNATSFSSELGNHLCEQHAEAPNAIALIFTVQENWSVRCSLRSIPGGHTNARKIAERYGGGGHEHAAGCRFENFDDFRRALEELKGG